MWAQRVASHTCQPPCALSLARPRRPTGRRQATVAPCATSSRGTRRDLPLLAELVGQHQDLAKQQAGSPPNAEPPLEGEWLSAACRTNSATPPHGSHRRIPLRRWTALRPTVAAGMATRRCRKAKGQSGAWPIIHLCNMRDGLSSRPRGLKPSACQALQPGPTTVSHACTLCPRRTRSKRQDV